MKKKDKTKVMVVVGLLLVAFAYYISKRNPEGFINQACQACYAGIEVDDSCPACRASLRGGRLRGQRGQAERARVRGCMDPEARNYNSRANVPGPCTPKECRCLTSATTAEEYSQREGVMERYKSIAGVKRYLDGVLRRIARPNTQDNYDGGCPMRSRAGTTYNCSDKTTKESCEAGPVWNRPPGNNNSYRHCEWK
tara:strand:- start:289 stop:876 length:588 start_codon:yes stop_codon:yes gene_type:complete